MTMPKAAVNEDNLLSAPKHKIRTAEHVFTMQGIAKAQGVNDSPYKQLRGGIFALYGLHRPPSDLWVFHYVLRIGVRFDSLTTSPARRMRVLLTTSAP